MKMVILERGATNNFLPEVCVTVLRSLINDNDIINKRGYSGLVHS